MSVHISSVPDHYALDPPTFATDSIESALNLKVQNQAATINGYAMITRSWSGVFKPKVLLAATKPIGVSYVLQQEHWGAPVMDEFLALL